MSVYNELDKFIAIHFLGFEKYTTKNGRNSLRHRNYDRVPDFTISTENAMRAAMNPRLSGFEIKRFFQTGAPNTPAYERPHYFECHLFYGDMIGYTGRGRAETLSMALCLAMKNWWDENPDSRWN